MHRRRTYLKSLAAGLTGIVAGCSGDNSGSKTGTTTTPTPPADTPSTTSSPTATTDGVTTQQAKITADDGDKNDLFGFSVAVSSDGTTAIIGAGSVYVFEKSDESWSQQAKLVADDGDNNFGQSVAVSDDGTTAIIGATNDQDPNGTRAGSAYVFESSGDSWSQQTKLTAEDGDRDDFFGFSVAVSSDGTTAIIGALKDEDPNGDNAGSGYVFEGTEGSWSQRAKLTAADGDSNDRFGSSVAMSSDGTTVIIGSSLDEDPNGYRAGSAYVFAASDGSWSQQAKLYADDGDSGDFFGTSVAVSDDGTTAIIGAYSDEDPHGDEAGSAYVFESTGDAWSQGKKLAADDGDSGDLFGTSVTVSGDGSTAIVGATNDEDPNGQTEYGNGAGSAYVFEEAGGAWSQKEKLVADDGDAGDNFGGSGAMSDDGSSAIVGAYDDDNPNNDSAGSVYGFNI